MTGRTDWWTYDDDAGAICPIGRLPTINGSTSNFATFDYCVRGLADEARATFPFPSIGIQANPGLGLVNVPVWFWANGYDGDVLSSQIACLPNAPQLCVAVTATPEPFTWTFEPGQSEQSDFLGEPFPGGTNPQPGFRAVTHTYQRQGPQGTVYLVQVVVRWRVAWHLIGQGSAYRNFARYGQPNFYPDPEVRTVTLPYQVRKLIAVVDE